MAAARAANAPLLTLYLDGPADGIPPAHGVPRGPVVRWLGIGGCVVLLGLLLLTLLTQPIGAAIERLIGFGPAPQQDRQAAAAPIDRAPPATPKRAATRDDPRAMPLPAGEAARMAARPGSPAPTRELAAPAAAGPLALLPPVPAFKQPRAGQ